MTQKIHVCSDIIESTLNEFNLKDLKQSADMNFIHMSDYLDQLRNRGVHYIKYDQTNPEHSSHGKWLMFRTELSEKSKKRYQDTDYWYQTIELLDFDEAMAMEGYLNRDKANLAIFGDIKVNCTCPAFTYWGYNYITTSIDAAMKDQNIEPNIRNPERKGTVCKHLYLVLDVLPFHIMTLVSELKSQGYFKPKIIEQPAQQQQQQQQVATPIDQEEQQ